MKESTDWKEGARILKELQEEWKKIGAVHERHSNKIWKRFRSACDSFFERRNAASSSEKNSLEENLKTKEALIAKLEALVAEDSPSSDAFQEIQTEWKATGHVPFKQKDKVNNAFRELMGKFFDKNRNSRHDYQKRNFEAELSSIPNGDERVRRLQGEIRKLRTRVQEVDGKVGQYEINVQYISKGKSGDVLRNQIQSQIDAEKAKLKDLKSKIKEIQSLIDNPPAAENPVLEPEGPSSDSETAEA